MSSILDQNGCDFRDMKLYRLANLSSRIWHYFAEIKCSKFIARYVRSIINRSYVRSYVRSIINSVIGVTYLGKKWNFG